MAVLASCASDKTKAYSIEESAELADFSKRSPDKSWIPQRQEPSIPASVLHPAEPENNAMSRYLHTKTPMTAAPSRKTDWKDIKFSRGFRAIFWTIATAFVLLIVVGFILVFSMS